MNKYRKTKQKPRQQSIRLNSPEDRQARGRARIPQPGKTPDRRIDGELLRSYRGLLVSEGHRLGRQVHQLARSLPREEHDRLQNRLLDAWEGASEALGKCFGPQVNGEQASHLCAALRAILSVAQQGYEAADHGFLGEDQLAKMQTRTKVMALAIASAYQVQYGKSIPLLAS
jgi:hypothetical protein